MKGLLMVRRLGVACFAAVLAALLWTQGAFAQTRFTVPITVGTATYTLTVTVSDEKIEQVSAGAGVKVGVIREVVEPARVEAQQSAEALLASAVTVPYDDLFRHNEKYVGKVVRYVGEVAQTTETTCFLCTDKTFAMRLQVTPAGYGFWEDAIWVDYASAERFLDDDIVTVWGTVTGLHSYTAVLGNEITLPKVEALYIQLGNVANPVVAPAPGAPYALNAANLRGGPGTSYAVVGSVPAGQALSPVGRTQDSSWYKLDGGAWIAAFLMGNAPTNLPVATAP